MEKIKKLRKLLIDENISGYIVPKNDEFFGEYIANYNERLNYISNFSGSSGFAIILKDENYLFVDGRYTLQASKQSAKYFKIITFPNKMPYDIFKNKKLSIGFDPKLFTKKALKIFFHHKNSKLVPIKNNLIDKIWKRKRKKIKSKFYSLPKNSAGTNYNFKINKIIINLKKKGADFQFITASENVAWLLNIRGADAKYSPIPNSYILISRNKEIKFFCDLSKVTNSLKKYLKKIKIMNIHNTNKILSAISKKKFIIDKNSCSFYFENLISKNNSIINSQDLIYDLKAIKTEKEIKNMRRAHIYDGAALTKYLFWVKKNFTKKKLTEISASQKLLSFRKENKNFKFSSFPTISGAGPNAAIIHYNASKKSDRILKQGDVYLVDSGGQYNFGTTDVTRTISLNTSSRRIKEIFTRVLKGHIAVAKFKLKSNSSGSEIDKIARKYLKQKNLDYAHGTGHGVGYFLNVHEGPHAISKNNQIHLKVGMVVSNEPGYYEKDKFGIRIENLIYVKKNKRNNIFENLTMVPIDKELIINQMLNKIEKNWLNNYHQKVFLNLKKFMNKFEILELKKACSAI